MPGSHCIYLRISDCGYAEYFDSYGLSPYKLEIIAFMIRYSIYWSFKSHLIQGHTSNVCRHYCCIYALHSARGQSMTSSMNMFVPVRYTCNDIKASAHVPPSVS